MTASRRHHWPIEMAGLNRGMKVLIGAWALAVLVLGGIFIWLALAEPARPPGLDQGAVARAVVDLRGHPPAEGVAIAKPAPASVPTGPAPALPADPVVPAPAAPDQADAPPAALPAAAVPPDAEKPRIYDPAELSEDGPYGPLPRVAPNGLAPYQAYSAAFDAPASMPRIAVVITGLGLSATLTQKALARLPATVTLAFSPYGYDLATWASQARVKGHELLVMVPMEPLDYPANDPGPHVLMKDATVAANLDRLYFVLSRFQGFVGVVNAMGSRITANETAMRPVLGELKARGLMFVDSRSTAFTVAARMAQEMGLRWAINNRFLDQSPTGSDIRDALSELEGRARSLGAAVGLARALPLSIDSIADWAATAAERGIAIAPITAVANAQPVR